MFGRKKDGKKGGVFGKLVAGIFALSTIVPFLAAFLFGLWLFHGNEGKPIEPGTALVLAPQGQVVEKAPPDWVGRAKSVVGLPSQQQSDIHSLIDSIKVAAKDERINRAVLQLTGLSGISGAHTDALIDAIETFKATGKPVIAWSAAYNQAQYRLAAQADTVILHPLGQVMLTGQGVFHRYYKGALDKLGIDIQVFKAGRYKSAVEPFVRSSMSDAARSANKRWTGNLWAHYTASAASERVSAQAIDSYVRRYPELVSSANGRPGSMAQEYGLVDRLASFRSFANKQKAEYGKGADGNRFQKVGYQQYLAGNPRIRYTGKPVGLTEDRTIPRIRTISINGTIVPGRGARSEAGAGPIVTKLDEARTTDAVKAVVLRVNSPGGSVFASERIGEAVAAVQKAGKPVVTSMAAMAASGGYWVAAETDAILAQPATITGSIGVFGLVPNIQRGLSKLGIETDSVTTHRMTGALRPGQPLGQAGRTVMRQEISRIYEVFTSRVAKARGLGKDKMKRVAGGRVWTGQSAQRRDLVDALGGLDQAIAKAASLAGLQPGGYRVGEPNSVMDRVLGPVNQLVASVFAARPGSGLWPLSGTRALAADFKRVFSDPRNAYALCMTGPLTVLSTPGDSLDK